MNSNEIICRVTAVHKERYEIEADGRTAYARLKGRVFYGEQEAVYPTVGDNVSVIPNEQGDSVITGTLKRSSVFLRLDPSLSGRGEQAVAANFSVVFIVSSLNHDLNPARLERYLTMAFSSGAKPVVLLTKADLCEDIEARRDEINTVAPAVEVVTISTLSGLGIERVRELMPAGSTAVFLGSSGVGKSTLVNALAGAEVMKTGGIREDDSRGRHTTTYRQLVRLPWGAYVIDTPGMRQLGMWDNTEGLNGAFPEVLRIAEGCRFADCAHEREPGCAVRRALESGELSPERWEAYLKLKNEGKRLAPKEKYKRKKEKHLPYRKS